MARKPRPRNLKLTVSYANETEESSDALEKAVEVVLPAQFFIEPQSHADIES